MIDKLTHKEQRFVEEYLKDFNGTQAVLRSGFSVKNEKVAGVKASKLLAKGSISALVAQKMQEMTNDAGVETIRVIKEVARIAFCDPRKIFTDAGTVKDIQDIDDDTAAAIGGIEIVDYFEPDAEGKKKLVGYIKKFKFWDKNPALDKLMRYLALYKDSGTPTNPLTVKFIDGSEAVKQVFGRT